jgi:hypothetical protein
VFPNTEPYLCFKNDASSTSPCSSPPIHCVTNARSFVKSQETPSSVVQELLHEHCEGPGRADLVIASHDQDWDAPHSLQHTYRWSGAEVEDARLFHGRPGETSADLSLRAPFRTPVTREVCAAGLSLPTSTAMSRLLGGSHVSEDISCSRIITPA